jgi:hypothetical protein
MLMWRAVVVVGLLPFLGSAWQKPKTPSVEFFLTDGYGNAIASEVRVHIISRGGTSSHWLNYPENRRIDLPAGRYTAVVEARGFLTNAEQLTVTDRDVFLPVSLTLAPIEGTEIPASLTGTIGRQFRDSAPAWVRLAGVYKSTNWTSKIDDNGRFSFESLPPGQYVLMIFNKGELKTTRTISVHAFANQITVE